MGSGKGGEPTDQRPEEGRGWGGRVGEEQGACRQLGASRGAMGGGGDAGSGPGELAENRESLAYATPEEVLPALQSPGFQGRRYSHSSCQQSFRAPGRAYFRNSQL